jgi:hypothetical protein
MGTGCGKPFSTDFTLELPREKILHRNVCGHSVLHLSIQDGALYKIGLSLILKANLAGGRDDTTVILIAFS